MDIDLHVMFRTAKQTLMYKKNPFTVSFIKKYYTFIIQYKLLPTELFMANLR